MDIFVFFHIAHLISGGSIIDDYLKQYREMISLRGLIDHTILSYSTYIKAYLSYLSDILHKTPEDVSWTELRGFIHYIHGHERRLGCPERLTCHSFRHAFGTHLYINVADLLTAKALMGHKSLNSTVLCCTFPFSDKCYLNLVYSLTYSDVLHLPFFYLIL